MQIFYQILPIPFGVFLFFCFQEEIRLNFIGVYFVNVLLNVFVATIWNGVSFFDRVKFQENFTSLTVVIPYYVFSLLHSRLKARTMSDSPGCHNLHFNFVFNINLTFGIATNSDRISWTWWSLHFRNVHCRVSNVTLSTCISSSRIHPKTYNWMQHSISTSSEFRMENLVCIRY